MQRAADKLRGRYQLNISRIFAVGAPALYRAFTEPDVLRGWFPSGGWRMPPDQVTIEAWPGGRFGYTLIDASEPTRRITTSAVFQEVAPDRLLTWTDEGLGGSCPVGLACSSARETGSSDGGTEGIVELIGEAAGQTRLELREGPFTWDEEIAERAWWNTAFSRLDTILEESAARR